jgi:hypothetical protein
MKLFALGLLLLASVAWAQIPQSKHVWLIAEENHSYEEVVGNSSMPYYNSLIAKYGLATQYYSEEHNSLSALMWLVAGQQVTTNDATTSCFNLNNIARQLIAKGYTWRSYQEELPYAGFAGISYANYVRRHNPIIDFTDTCAAAQKYNSVPFTQLATDIANKAVPNYVWITPDVMNDAHNGTLQEADSWLAAHVPAILALPEFQPGGDGLLFIAWDESELSGDNRCSATIMNGCGGRLATLVIGPQVKPGYKSSVRYDHANLLRTVCDAMELNSCPGAAAVEAPMADFFNTVSIATPFPNSTVASPVHIQATTSDSAKVIAMQIYVDNTLKYQVAASSLNASLPISVGNHFIVAQSWDAAGGIHKRGIYVTVKSEAVVVMNPAPQSVVSQSVQVGAFAGGQQPVRLMHLYVDGNSQYQSSGGTLNTSLALTPGAHTLTVEASDSSGDLVTNSFPITSALPAVNILSPAPNSTFYSPMYVSAATIDPTPVIATQVYVDNQLAYQVTGTGVQAQIPLPAGQHFVVVQEWNRAGATYKRGVKVNVANVPITISSPKANATVGTPVTISASAPSSSPVQTMQIYIDNSLAYSGPGQTISQNFRLNSGRHYIVAKGWDGSDDNWYTGEYITVK